LRRARSSGLPLISAKDIGDHIELAGRLIDADAFALEDRRTEVRPGNVLLTIVGTIGRTAVVPHGFQPFTLQRSVAVLKPRLLDPRFLAYQLQSERLQNSLRAHARGTAQKGIYLNSLDAIEIRVAPLPEQIRIADTLDKMFSHLGASVTALERARANLKRYRASVLKAAVEGRLVLTEAELARKEGRDFEPASVLLDRILVERRRRWEESELARMNATGKPPKDDRWKSKYDEPVPPDISNLPQLPEGWCWASLDQLGKVSGGLTKNQAREKMPTRLPYLRVANVYANQLRLGEILDIGVEPSELTRVRLEAGDLLVVEGNGSPDQIGRVAIWDGSIDPCVHQNHLIKVRFGNNALSQWSLNWLLSPTGHSSIARAASSTSGLHTLSISKVARVSVPLAPLAEQARAISELQRRESVCAEAIDTVTKCEKRAGRLRQSILKCAFEGRLTGRDPNDEPASVLLERIRAERAAYMRPPKSRKSTVLDAEAAK